MESTGDLFIVEAQLNSWQHSDENWGELSDAFMTHSPKNVKCTGFVLQKCHVSSIETLFVVVVIMPPVNFSFVRRTTMFFTMYGLCL